MARIEYQQGTDKAMMYRIISQRPFVLTSLLLFLAACSSTPPEPPAEAPGPVDHSERYTIEQDRAPTEPLDPSSIREVVPVAETRTIAGNFSPYTVNGRRYTVMDSEKGYEETGVASWYGEKFHGHRTSNGEIFDMYQVSAAHTALPIPSYLRVTNLENERSIIVRVNDRGPFHSDRIVDLSYAGAYLLGFAEQGTASVHLEAVIPEGQEPEGAAGDGRQLASSGQYLQVGAFSDRQTARRVLRRMEEMTTSPVFIRSVQRRTTEEPLYRVRIGPIADEGEVGRITDRMIAADMGQPMVVEE